MTAAWGHHVPARTQRFLEREPELERIAAALRGAAGGGSWPVLIVGGAGLGKSSLLGAARGRAVALGIAPLWARAEELESTLPWSLARQLLAPALASLPIRDRDVVLSGAAARARALLDDDAASAPANAALLPLVHSLFWVIAGLAERTPLALLIDDAHLADEPSMLLLAYLGRRLAELPVTLVLAHRPVAPGPATGPLDELTAHAQSEPINLAPLSAGAVAALTLDALGAAVGAELTDACLEVTGGNPFYLQELLRALLAVPEQTPTVAAVRALVPTAVARSLFLRLTRLPADAGRLARAAAVLGERATLPRAAELAGLDPQRTAELADQLAEAEILRPGEPLRFIHPLVGAAIHDDLPPSQRSDWHRRAAGVLDRGGAEPTVLAGHLLSTGARSDQWVVDRLRSAAAAAASQGGFAAAAQYLVRALEEPPRADQRADVLIELGRIESALGRPSATERLRSALELTDELEQRARLRFELGRALHVGGEHAEAARTFEQGLNEVQDLESELARELRAAWWMAASADPVERARVITAGAAEVGQGELQPTLGQRQLTAQLAQEQAFAGQRGEMLKTLAERAWGDGALLEGETSDGLTWPLVTGALLAADELEFELQICDAVLADARRRGSPMAYASASYCRAWPLLRRGQVSDAIADAQAAVGAHDDGWAAFLPMAAAVLALAQLERGDLEAVRAALSLADTVPELSRSNQFPMVLIARGRLLIAERDFAGGAATIQRAGELVQAIGFDSPTLFPWRSEAARAASLAGQAATAAQLADAGLSAAERTGIPLAVADALRAKAATDSGDAIELLQRALGLLPQAPRLERVHALVMLGATLRRANRRRQATDALRHASELATAGGALSLVDTARMELAAMGVRVKRAAGDGPTSLTPTEERVARLAADGHSNREIAQMLFVTVKTVEFHLGNGYRKLGVNSRSQLARALPNGPA